MGERSLREEIADLVKIALIGETVLGEAEERLIVKVALVHGMPSSEARETIDRVLEAANLARSNPNPAPTVVPASEPKRPPPAAKPGQKAIVDPVADVISRRLRKRTKEGRAAPAPSAPPKKGAVVDHQGPGLSSEFLTSLGIGIGSSGTHDAVPESDARAKAEKPSGSSSGFPVLKPDDAETEVFAPQMFDAPAVTTASTEEAAIAETARARAAAPPAGGPDSVATPVLVAPPPPSPTAGPPPVATAPPPPLPVATPLPPSNVTPWGGAKRDPRVLLPPSLPAKGPTCVCTVCLASVSAEDMASGAAERKTDGRVHCRNCRSKLVAGLMCPSCYRALSRAEIGDGRAVVMGDRAYHKECAAQNILEGF